MNPGFTYLMAIAAGMGSLRSIHAAVVLTERVPHGGIQPQVRMASDGTIHLVYFDGEPRAGNARYVRREPGDSRWSEPIEVNSQAGSVIALGTIRGPQLALGRNGQPHVVWNGSAEARPRGPEGQSPLLYTRLSEDRRQFEPQRNLIHHAYGLDGGACIAADSRGSVYVGWHAGEGGGESERRIYLSSSTDGGETFDRERTIDEEQLGACGCCAMQGTATPGGKVLFLYRSADQGVHRDMYLLTATDPESEFSSRRLDSWKTDTCPMSSEAFLQTENGIYAAWETGEQVFFSRVSDPTPQPISAPGRGVRRKHPALVANEGGEILLVWTEGTGWNRGGSVSWCVFDSHGKPTEIRGSVSGLPVWSFAQPYVRSDGAFVVLY